MRKVLIFFLSLGLLSSAVRAERIKDLANVQSLRSMLTQLGIVVPPGTKINPKNVAAVTVHAELPPFVKPGQRIDVTVSSIGDAKSLRGGSLLMTPLKGIDGKVYAIAQGNLVVGGLSAEGADGSRVTINIPSSGRIPDGATVERTVATGFASNPTLTLTLKEGDFTTVSRVVKAINDTIGPGTARALDMASVQVNAPADIGQRVTFMSMIENIEVEPAQAVARVIVNSRTGTVVINQAVRVAPAAVSHGSMTVTISEAPQASQPNPLSGGQTVVVPNSQVDVTENGRHMFKFAPGVTLDEVVRAVNEVGAGPSDLVAILEALKQAGALKADLVII